MNDKEILKIENAGLQIGGTEILRSLTFSIRSQETVGIIGPNGSGKTSLFNCISGFLRLSAGNIFLNSQNINDLKPDSRARLGIGRVFQNSGVFREMSLLDNMLLALESRDSLLRSVFTFGEAKRQRQEKAINLLGEVGLAERARKNAATLSGGQLRLLEIARMLAFGAEVFLLDEPTAGVSPRMKDDVVVMINKLKELGKTTLIIEHDINFIERFCERILVLNVGTLLLDNTPAEIKSNPVLKDIYFGSGTNFT